MRTPRSRRRAALIAAAERARAAAMEPDADPVAIEAELLAELRRLRDVRRQREIAQRLSQ